MFMKYQQFFFDLFMYLQQRWGIYGTPAKCGPS